MRTTTVRLKLSFLLIVVFCFSAFAETTLTRIDSRYKEGLRYRRENRYNAALKVWESILKTNPAHPETLKGMVELTFFLGRYEECARYGKQILETSPDEVDLYFYVGTALSYAGRMDDSRAVLEKGLQFDPGRSDLLFQLGDVELALDRLSSARSYYEKIFRAHPKDDLAAYKIGFTWATEGNAKKARRWLEKALKWNPGLAEAHFSLGLLELDAERWEAAQNRFEKTVALQHVHPRAFFYLSGLEQRNGNPLKEFYWLVRAEKYFPKASREKNHILKRQKELEGVFSKSTPQLRILSRHELPVALGDTPEAVSRLLGKPDAQNANGSLYIYNRLSLNIQFKLGKVTRIDLEAPYRKKVYGLAVGDPKEKVLEALGDSVIREEAQWRARFQDQWLVFELKKDKINKISLVSL